MLFRLSHGAPRVDANLGWRSWLSRGTGFLTLRPEGFAAVDKMVGECGFNDKINQSIGLLWHSVGFCLIL